MTLSTPHLLGIRDLTPADINLILSTAEQFKDVLQRPVKKVPTLRDVTVVNLFFENSTRTRISFELAEKRLSADTINLTTSGSSVAKGESLLDTVQNILSMKVDLVVIRHASSGAPHFLSQHVAAAIINAGDGINEHPTQALLDAFSMKERFGKLEGLKVALIGDIMHSRVAKSNMYLLTRMGAEVTVCGPPTLIPPHIESAFSVKVNYNLRETLEWCDVANVLRIQLERQNQVLFSSLREYSLSYGINQELLNSLNKDITIMHPGPINRGVELDSDAADSRHSIILQQVENGVATRMAVLYLLAGRKQS